jgi:hypothetical protein
MEQQLLEMKRKKKKRRMENRYARFRPSGSHQNASMSSKVQTFRQPSEGLHE